MARSERASERPTQCVSCSTGSFIELQIPPDTGNGSWNAGIPLARLLWHLKSGPLMALLQAILLERRILMVAQERDTLSASLHAAAALLYPFRWQHIYLPLLPHNLKACLSTAARAVHSLAAQQHGCVFTRPEGVLRFGDSGRGCRIICQHPCPF